MMNEEITLRLETFNDKEYILADECIKTIGIHRKTNTKLHKEIKRLKEEYMILQNASDEVEEEKDREIERLNNIINELEKYINETKLEEFEKAYGRRYGKTFTLAEVIICNMILNKLHKLKGSDKE